MEYNGFKIDITAITALIGAVTGLYLAVKGVKQRNKYRSRNESENKDTTSEG